MKTSQVGIALIKGFEGFCAKPYLCPAGKNTIGFGHLIQEGELFHDVSEAEAEVLLANDLDEAEDAVLRLVKAPLNQHQFDALVSFVFNLGEGNFKGSTMLRYLNAGKYDAAADQFKRWCYVNHQVSKGVASRRNAEADLFRSK